MVRAGPRVYTRQQSPLSSADQAGPNTFRVWWLVEGGSLYPPHLFFHMATIGTPRDIGDIFIVVRPGGHEFSSG